VLRIRDVYPGSGMFILDPDFFPSRIPDLGSRIQKQQQKRGVPKKLSLSSQNMGLGSGKTLFRIPDPGVKKAPDPGFGSVTLHEPHSNLRKFAAS
jgi:hypothetical protein